MTESVVPAAPSPSSPPTRTAAGLRARAWWIVLLVGSVAIGISRLLPDGMPRSVPFQLFGILAASGIVLGVRLHRPAQVSPWYLMAAGQLIWSCADIVGSIGGELLGEVAFPTPADALYLAGYPIVGFGLLLLHRDHSRRGLAGRLDSAIVAVALGLLSWVAVAQPTLAAVDVSTAAALVGVAYPVADVVLAAILIRLVPTPWARTPSFCLLAAALGLLLVADVLAAAFEQLTWTSSDLIEPIWMLSYLCWATAALHPSMAATPRPARDSGRSFSRAGLIALAIALVMPGALLAAQELAGKPVAVWPIVIGWALTCGLVIARTGVAVRAMDQAHAERERALAALVHQATHDPLTGLPNRAHAIQVITAGLNRARRAGELIGLLFIDLDGFKQVNDTLGHAAGDEVLTAASARMQRGVRAGDVVARLGGDEFVVLLEPVADEAGAVGVAERLVADLAEPIRLSSGREARIGASIGVAINSDLTVDPDRLLQEADHAVFQAKAGGRGRVEVFAPALRVEVEERTAVGAAVLGALRHGTPTVQPHPVVDLRSGACAGVQLEVAVPGPDGNRWPRDELVPLIGSTDKLCDLDSWVLRTGVLGQDGDGWLMVPVTGRHLGQGTIVADVSSALAAGLALDRLMLLVPTEEVDGVRVLDTLEQLRGLGVRICADSFGADDSGTDRWARVPYDYVQLDRRLLSVAGAGLLLRLTVETANAFGYGVIAPGIGTPEEAEMLAKAGCELGLGPLYRDLSVTAAGR